MCNKYSFLLTRAGKILDGEGLTESHSEIASLHDVDEDKCNKYEWQPPEGWPDAEVLDGLVKDAEVFTPGASALKRIAAHLIAKFPTVGEFKATTPVDERWHMQTVTLGGRDLTVVCRPTAQPLTAGTFLVFGQTVTARDNATVTARGNATVTAWGNAAVTAGGNATVTAWGNATVTARGNAAVTAGGNATVTAWGNATVTARDNATVTARVNATVTAGGDATVTAGDNAAVTAWDNAAVTAGGNATVTARGNATVTAWGNATVTARGNAAVIYPAGWWTGKVSTALQDMAVLIDRRNGGLVITRGDQTC